MIDFPKPEPETDATISCLLVVALPIEARPLVEHFKLGTSNIGPYRYWCRDNIALIQTGMGKLNASAATSHALAATGAESCINVGIAGSDNELGALFIADRIIDQGSGQVWYPQQTWKMPGPSLTVTTLDKPGVNYQSAIAYEMEASGVMAAAINFLSTELIQSLKIISDNPSYNLEKIDKQQVHNLIKHKLNVIEQAVNRLRHLVSTNQDINTEESLIKSITHREHPQISQKLHLTQSQQHDFKRLLQRHQALKGSLPGDDFLGKFTDSRQLIDALRRELDSIRSDY